MRLISQFIKLFPGIGVKFSVFDLTNKQNYIVNKSHEETT